jgi:prepilin-type N-terminal cleavage/methylation domain-containing protein
MGQRPQPGFTLVEMLVAVAIAALLLVMAAPQYALWIADAHIRSAAESIASGLRWAQAEAIKRNTQVEFILNPTTATGGWDAHVVTDAAGVFVQTGKFADGAGNSQFAVIPAGTTTVTFSGWVWSSPQCRRLCGTDACRHNDSEHARRDTPAHGAGGRRQDRHQGLRS